MVEKIAYRTSAAVLLVAALAIVALLVMGLTRADAGRPAIEPMVAPTETATAEPAATTIAEAEPAAADFFDIAEKSHSCTAIINGTTKACRRASWW